MGRADRLVARLKKCYGALPSPPSDAFSLFVWQILWNHSTAKKRDTAMAGLKRLGALTPEGMWNASPKALFDAVNRAGPYAEQRLMGLRKGVEVFRREPEWTAVLEGPVPAALRRLKTLPRMTGDSTAYRMLLFAGNQPVLPVDARVARVATRLGYGERVADFSKTARSIRLAIAPEMGPSVKNYRDAYLYFDHHGGTTCAESHPHCDECVLAKECPSRQA